MNTAVALRTNWTDRIVSILIYLTAGLLIFLFGANTFSIYQTNKNPFFEWGLTLLLLLLAVIFQRVPRLNVYVKIVFALFFASLGNAVNLSLGGFLIKLFHLAGEDMRFFAIDKLSQAIPIVLSIILLSLWSGDDLGSIFLKRGNLRLGLQFGLISFAVFAVIFIVIVVLQANAPKSVGLFATGISIATIVRAIPWILLFCFVNSFMEELWFRGVFLNKLTPLTGRLAAIIVTAVVFGVSHSAATYITSVQMVLFPVIVVSLGLVNAYMMLKTDSLLGSVFFHAGYDLLVIIPILAST